MNTQPAVIVDKQKIEEFLSRGVDKVLPSTDALRQKLLSGERISAYMGFDPTGPYLHVGHAMGIRALRQLQELGHRVIFLVGDYTARVGDPDKDSTRKLLTDEDIASNMAGWKQQAGQLIDFEDKQNPVEFAGNHQWLSQLRLIDLIGLMSKVTVQQILERDLFQRRLAKQKPLQFQEMLYPLMQGYDSVAMKVDLELGGTDQIFNMLMGRELCQSYLGKEKYVRAHKLMPAPDSLTMSKTRGNGINLGDNAEQMYGIAMSYPDTHILTGLELLTETPLAEIADIQASLTGGANPMQYKKLLAYRIVELIKGTDAAQQAELHFQQTVQQRQVSEDRTKISLKLLSARLEKLGKLGDTATMVAELQRCSKTQAKQLLSQGGVELNQSQKLTVEQPVSLKAGDLLKVGKRNWYEIVD